MSDSSATLIARARSAPFWLPAGTAGLVLLLDQLSKWIVIRTLGPDEEEHRIEVLGSALAFHYVENSGAAFGLLQGQTAFLTVVAAVVVIGLIVSYARHRAPTPILAVGLGLLVGGALGNLIDRYRFGYVVDFVSVGIFPKFNVADSAITFGVILLGFHMLRDGSGAERDVQRPAEAERQSIAMDAER